MESKIITVTLKRKEAQSQETSQKLRKSHLQLSACAWRSAWSLP